jgi:predicted porin
MQLKATGVAVLAALSAMAVCAEQAAASNVTISGVIDVNVERLSTPKESVTRVSSGGLSNSRLEFSAVEDLGDGNQAFFLHQMQFAADTGTGPTPRETYVGMRGNWGQLALGRQNTPSYWIVGYADPSWSGDYSRVSNNQYFYAPWRESNAVSYNTPVFAGFKGRFMATTGQETADHNGRVISTGVEYRSGPLYLGFVSDHKDIKNIASPKMESSRDNYISATYRIDSVEPTFIYHTYNGYYAYPPYVGFQTKGWDVQLGARWKIGGPHGAYISAVHRHDNVGVDLTDANSFLVGYNYRFSKRTDAYINYGRVLTKGNPKVPYPLTFNYNGSANPERGTQVGLRHSF